MKAKQNELKQQYEQDPQSALLDLMAEGTVDFERFAFCLEHPASEGDLGMHPASGGDGSFRCPVEIMLAGWIGCFGVTLAAVASSMRLEIESCRLKATGLLDFRGTLAVDREAPVGLIDLKLNVQIVSQESPESLEKLIQLSERYCVVHQTLAAPPILEIKRS